MCGIAGVCDLQGRTVPGLEGELAAMTHLLRHRGPDGEGSWRGPSDRVGFTHLRLAIIDLVSGIQPMTDAAGNWIVCNGEIYNYVELREELGVDNFKTTSDIEVILAAYRRWGRGCLEHLRGMFSFAIWDPADGSLFCARDRFGMKPFYYAVVDGRFYFASEAKALLPFLPKVETDPEGLRDYLTFQFCLDGKTLFSGIRELPPGHQLVVRNGTVEISRYWDVYYRLDFGRTAASFEEQLRELMADSVRVHLRADVPVGAYLSGGLDSSIVASLAADERPGELLAFNGKFAIGPAYDESVYARELSQHKGISLHELDITVSDFVDQIRRVIYHLDYPVAGPGAFPQFMVSELASRHRKVVLGGQGGDELFGGYTRYLVAYLEQCLRAAIDGTMHNGNFVVTYESILPNLTALRQYKPMLQDFWREGMFEPMDRRYFRLITRASHLQEVVRWHVLGDYSPYDTFRSIFQASNLEGESYFDRMTHFDFKTLLPALLQVEDRMSMAHGLESRLPFLDHPIVELAATIPADVKFEGGQLKKVLRSAFATMLPTSIVERQDKMGFPTPLNAWAAGPARDFVSDILSSRPALERNWVDNRRVLASLGDESAFGRGFWGLLSLEIWQREFHDRASHFRDLPARLKEGQVA
ncbi:MAG: asparagine synthase (glutamine-hydrolyzing) [Chloroflexota bacterium]|nr:asparagine synthase (glutamine-hydrolyzing) [Chloroflexota bacterium]